MEFLEHGIRYVFPQVPGSMVTGIATGHSHSFYKQHFASEFNYVWPYEGGNMRGLAIQPLHKGVPKASLQDELLYELLAGIDILRVGRVREKTLALKQLQKVIL